ncbi:hypothetical protein [Aeromicrobium sp.]|uniref:hypothetical protein n=1 Tax=Aeromicrobium sp. TaxID=1871063 RepID=UPI002FCA672A
MTRDDLIRDAAWDILGSDQNDADKIRQQLRTPAPVVAPEPDEPRHVGDLPRGYGIAFTLARNAWKRATTNEGETA